MKNRNFPLIAMLSFLTSFSASAGIQNITYECGATHKPGFTYNIPDAPSYKVQQVITTGRVGKNASSVYYLISTNYNLDDIEHKYPLTLVSETGTIKAFSATDYKGTSVTINTSTETAEVKIGNAQEAECTKNK